MLWKIDQCAPPFGQNSDRQRLQLDFLLISISIHKFSTEGRSMLILDFILKEIKFLKQIPTPPASI